MIYNTINDAQTIAGNGEGTLLANRYCIMRQLGQGTIELKDLILLHTKTRFMVK